MFSCTASAFTPNPGNLPSVLGQFNGCTFLCDNCNLLLDINHMLENKTQRCISCDCTIFKVRWSDGDLAAKIQFDSFFNVFIINKRKTFRYK